MLNTLFLIASRMMPNSYLVNSELAATVIIFLPLYALVRLFWWLSGKQSDTSSIPGLGRSLGERNGNPLQYSCLGNTMDGGA